MEDQAKYRAMETGFIYKSKTIKNQFTQISNILIRDKEIPALPYRILTWLLSHDPENFRITRTGVSKQIYEGERATLTAFNWLIDAGYVYPVEIFSGNLSKGFNYLVYDKPLTKDEHLSENDKIRYHSDNNLHLEHSDRDGGYGGGEKSGIKNTNNKNIYSKPKSEKLSGSKPNNIHDQLKKLITYNPKSLKHLPATVYKEKVSRAEALFVIGATKILNDIRSMYLGGGDVKLLGVNPNAKACRGLIEECRGDVTLELLEQAVFNMFEEKFHKENNYKYITLEFISRRDKFDMYNFKTNDGED